MNEKAKYTEIVRKLQNTSTSSIFDCDASDWETILGPDVDWEIAGLDDAEDDSRSE